MRCVFCYIAAIALGILGAYALGKVMGGTFDYKASWSLGHAAEDDNGP